MTERWTIGRLLSWTTDYLTERGAASPQLEAEALLATARGCERARLYAALGEPVPAETRARFSELIQQRANGTPVWQLTGHREFYSLTLRVCPQVFIPRPETEFVVVAALAAMDRSLGAAPCVADVGTGTGAIGIAIAQHAKGCRVIGIDTSIAALGIARQNAAEHSLAHIAFVAGDLLTPLASARTLSIIASNPPYLSDAQYDRLSPAVRRHEPRSALVGGKTGTEIIERLIPQAAERLKPGGVLIFEANPATAPMVAQLLSADGRFQVATSGKDLTGQVRTVQARRRD